MKIQKSSWFYILSIGVILGIGITIMQLAHYKWLIFNHSFELYAIIVAIIFTFIGIWAGKQLIKKKTVIIETIKEIEKPIFIESNVSFNKDLFIEKTGISERELEVLQQLVKGYSNQEIANHLFLSLSTIKTHVSNIFLKLEVSRRTQAIQKAREWGIR